MRQKNAISRFVCLCLVCGSFQALLCLAQNRNFRGMTIHRSGGFVGIEEEWDFSDKGTRYSGDRVSIQVPLEKLQRLRQLVTQKVKKEPSQPPPISVCCDCFTYRITVWYDESPQTLQVGEAAVKADADGVELLALVRELIKE